MCCKKRVLLLIGVLFLSGTISVRAQYSYTDTPLLAIIEDVQNKTEFSFLYRESMISGIRLSFKAGNGNLFPILSRQLETHRLRLKVDSLRQQAVLFKPSEDIHSSRDVRITGHVLDSSTGERLPFATVSWKTGGETHGVSSNNAGTFHIEKEFSEDVLTLTASYVGYASKSITFDLNKDSGLREISFRLEPAFLGGNELIITGSNYYTSSDSSLKNYVNMGTFSPLGESNSLRALQVLPSVGLSTAMDGEMHVRGSSSDGFRVLLDGITIFNQSHLFGLLDSFNSDVLQTSGFFYDITPAQYQAPPGGTLSLLTKTGSLNRLQGTFGLSNSSARLSLEGPIKKGRSSWLISGRNSFIDAVNWMNNSDLIEWGLDVNRPKKVTESGINLESFLIRPGDHDARFFDLHGKLYFEGNAGNRFIVSAYYGGDNTSLEAQRLFRQAGTTTFEFQPVETTNNWSNLAASIHYQASISPGLFSNTTAAVSIYETDFSKDDFTYTRFNSSQETFQIFTYPFGNKSILNELKFDQQFDFKTGDLLWTAGATYQYYLGEYFENSFERISQFFHTESHKVDLYTQSDFTASDFFHIHAGSRLYYYSNGEYLRWSPRVKVKLFPESRLSVGGGYSRNHQFLNQISFSNAVSSDVWIMANAQQPPVKVDYYSAGTYLDLGKALYLQLEGYIKESDNLRIHEIDTYSLSNTFNEAPWFFNSDGLAQGVELLIRSSFSRFEATQTLTYGSVEMVNEQINEGQPFHAEWDRSWQYIGALEVEVFDGFSTHLSFTYATGTPNKLAVLTSGQDERLGDYYRTDLTLQYIREFDFGGVEASLSLFNIFDRQNEWYREMSFILQRNNGTNSISTAPVNVYDIGFQPSFNLSVSF